jgi:hypothetical protein
MKYRHHKYTWKKPFGVNVYHSWELVGPVGAVHFHVSLPEKEEAWPPSCGLEFHHTEACGWSTDEAPHHVDCPLTGGRCWHDGTSLYASETLWPRVEGWLRAGDHNAIFRLLEREADRRFDDLILAQRLRAAAAE